ncbi:hypothetical protein SS50377_28083 [Spironucleus salmonicida]|uniref:Uncharacterized protein n=1 Tax=Spironucleus salmonicida TaxID=348837 RepID=V6LPI4_9EUKA|nr:hypothetical protein SS50377_28083 [Spironucleus salmonicida]|eukprot:EST42634.1 Hypothetical protein SS50377_17953 [Spironucleus salmonicida]
MNGTLFTPDQRQVPVTVTLGDKVMFVSTDKFKTAVDLAGESVHILRSDCISTLVDTIAGIRIEVDTREIPICTIDETLYGYQMMEFQYTPQGLSLYNEEQTLPCFTKKQYCISK